MALCKVDGCQPSPTSRFRRGYCNAHYKRLVKYGDPLITRKVRNVCAVGGCGLLVTGHGWCSKHYTRWVRYGDPLYRIAGEVRDGKRICSQCGEDKPVELYGRNGNPPSRGLQNRVATGLNSRCKPCLAANRSEWRSRNPGYEYKPDDPRYYADAQQRWRTRNPDKVKKTAQARRARRFGATVEEFSPREIFDRDEWNCHICMWPIDSTIEYPDPLSPSIDHVIPLARGGEHSRANCRASHLRCNLKKQAKVA